MRILIADDEPLLRLGMVSMIEELFPGQHRITEAGDGNALVERAHALPDLAFVDIKMPHMSGIEAIARAKPISPGTRWVMVSGFADFEFAQQAIRLGVSDYLLKPVEPNQLRALIEATADWLQTHAPLIDEPKLGVSGRQLRAYVDAHYKEDLSVGALADELGITPNYLSTLFRQQTGETFVSYLSKTRIEAAKRLLDADPLISTREISAAVGYFNPRHFAKVFAKITGLTPSQYQRRGDVNPKE